MYTIHPLLLLLFSPRLSPSRDRDGVTGGDNPVETKPPTGTQYFEVIIVFSSAPVLFTKRSVHQLKPKSPDYVDNIKLNFLSPFSPRKILFIVET